MPESVEDGVKDRSVKSLDMLDLLEGAPGCVVEHILHSYPDLRGGVREEVQRLLRMWR